MDGAIKIKNDMYYIMGMKILSEIVLPGVSIDTDCYDVKIVYCKFDIVTENVLEFRNYYYLNQTDFVCDIKKVAKFRVTGGCLIQIDLYEQADLELVAVYLLGTCMGALLMQRGMVTLHGSTIVMNGQSVIITGRCGAGKSTLSTALRLRGNSILSDDISPVIIHDNEVMSVPAYPKQRICEDTAIMMGIDTGILVRACSEDFKYNVDVSKEFVKHPVKLFGIIEIVPEEVEDVTLTELKSSEKLELIRSNIYCKEFYTQVDFQPSYFKKLLEIAGSIHTYRLIRPKGHFTVDRQIEIIMDEIKRITGGGKHEEWENEP